MKRLPTNTENGCQRFGQISGEDSSTFWDTNSESFRPVNRYKVLVSFKLKSHKSSLNKIQRNADISNSNKMKFLFVLSSSFSQRVDEQEIQKFSESNHFSRRSFAPGNFFLNIIV
jgi:hypothetical protein